MGLAQSPPRPQQASGKITLDTNPALFATLAALGACGNETGTSAADPLRGTIRAELSSVLSSNLGAQEAAAKVCKYVAEHQLPDRSRELAQYISLALNLSGPPFAFKGKEADLPPDASAVAGFLSPLNGLFSAAGLDRMWSKYQPQYEQRIRALNPPLSKMLLETDLYLRLPFSSYLGREFVVYVEPMLPANQVNARNYGANYYVALSPARAQSDEVRHAYLHYVLDPLMLKRAKALQRLEPIMQLVSTAPMDESYKRDSTLLVTESLIQAVEARTAPATGDARQIEAKRSALAQDAMAQGFVLTRYFYEQLQAFEKETTGIKDAFTDMLYQIEVNREQKRASEVNFATSASKEVVARQSLGLLDLAERKLAANDIKGARKLAQQVVDEKTPGEDPARALFVLARSAALDKDIDGAQVMFERTLEIAKEPRIVAWSHISLARILDLKCSREQAIGHYKAALTAGDARPETRNAAERGLQASSVRRCEGVSD